MNKTVVRKQRSVTRRVVLCLLLAAFGSLAVGCRYDMQDQPRLKPYKTSEFFRDGKGMQDPPENTVARGHLNENKAFYTGKKEDADPNIQVETTIDASGNTLVSSFPNDVEEFPIPVTEELLQAG